MRLLCICGALHQNSGNHRLLLEAAALASPEVVVTHDALLGQLPLFNLDLEHDGAVPVVARWRAQLAQCDGVLIACPEYAFSLSGALKNGIDWVVGSGELEGKLVAATALVAGPPRGRRGLQALEQTLGALSCEICWNQPISKSCRTDDLTRLLATLKAAHEDRLLRPPC